MIRPNVGPVYYVGQECWARWGDFRLSEAGKIYTQRLVIIEKIDPDGIHVRTLDGHDGDQSTATFELDGTVEIMEEKVILVPVIETLDCCN